MNFALLKVTYTARNLENAFKLSNPFPVTLSTLSTKNKRERERETEKKTKFCCDRVELHEFIRLMAIADPSL